MGFPVIGRRSSYRVGLIGSASAGALILAAGVIFLPARAGAQAVPAQSAEDPSSHSTNKTPAGDPGAVTPEAPPSGAVASSPVNDADIVVTAQRRTERLQDVPVSVEVVGSEALKGQNLTSLESISEISPSVHIGTGNLSDQLYIRGIGAGGNPSFDQAVGTFIDDIYHGRSRTSSATFLDLDQIEILKGPQSTFFGNNAIAGAFNITTKAPSFTAGGTARLLYGSYGERVAEVAMGGPLTDKLAIRAVLHYDGMDGWLNEVSDNRKIPEQDNFAGRLSLVYKPTDRLEIKLKVEASSNKQNGIPYQGDECPPPAPFSPSGFCAVGLSQGLGPDFNLNSTNNTQSPGQFIKLNTQEYVGTINYDLSGHTLTSVTGYQRFTYNQNLDVDNIPSQQIISYLPEDYSQFSQEVRLTSPSNQKIEYLVGGYFQTDKLDSSRIQIFPYLNPTINSLPPLAALVPYLPIGQDVAFTQHEQSYALFGSATWNVTSSLKITGGIRATWVHKSIDSLVVYGAGSANGDLAPLPGTLNALPALPTGLQLLAGKSLGAGTAGTVSLARTDRAVLPSANVQYFFTPDVQVYGRYARGFLAGGFNGQETSGDPSTVPFSPESVNSYEIGLKTELLDRRLTFNLDGFISNYSNLQVTQSLQRAVGSRSFVTNAAGATSRGVELESQFRPTPNFRLSAGVTYLDAHFVSYPNVALTALGTFCHTAANVGNATCIASFGGNGDPGATRDLAGQQTPFSPKWSGNVSAEYGLNIGSIRLTPAVSGIFSSSYFPSGTTLNEPLMQQGSYFRVDARLKVTKMGSGWSLDIIGKNLNNINVETGAVGWPSSNGSFVKIKEEPRNIAGQIRLDW